jgi:hypothetical protein
LALPGVWLEVPLLRGCGTVKQIGGVVVTACGILIAATVTGIAMLWWITSDAIRQMRQR